MEHKPFVRHREAALALLYHDKGLNRVEGGFLGQLVADPSPLSYKQADWLAALLERAGLPPIAEEQVP
ncbi:hypothetical protein [Aurantiacibacter gilvus]|uniref:Uncharacterized protein n=1 Tax=Aurantiacibacter gilvus TaxID=3139141 RepID=A0ABU9IJ26_9SPHN